MSSGTKIEESDSDPVIEDVEYTGSKDRNEND